MWVKVGDRVVGFMSNRIETVVAMLAATSIRAVWSACSPNFGLEGLVDCFGQIEPKVLFAVEGHAYKDKIYDHLDKYANCNNIYLHSHVLESFLLLEKTLPSIH